MSTIAHKLLKYCRNDAVDNLNYRDKASTNTETKETSNIGYPGISEEQKFRIFH